MLSRLDDYPIHQMPFPVTQTGTSDRNHYDLGRVLGRKARSCEQYKGNTAYIQLDAAWGRQGLQTFHARVRSISVPIVRVDVRWYRNDLLACYLFQLRGSENEKYLLFRNLRHAL